MRLRLVRTPTIITAVFAVYFLAGKLGSYLAFVNASASAVAPAAGVALAAFLIFGYRVWPAIVVGAFLLNISTAWSLTAAAAIGVGNTLEALLGAYLVNRFAGGRRAFQSAVNILRFSALVALASTTVSATVGVVSLSLTGFATWSDYGSIWVTFWLANVTGSLLVAPFALLWSSGPWQRWTLSKINEAAALLGVLALVGWVIFGGILPAEVRSYPLEFLCIPIILWAAFRFGRREVATTVVLLSSIAIWGTLSGHGPFVRVSPNESILLLQTFMSLTAVLSAALAALVSEYALAEAQLRELAITDALTGLPNYRRLVEVLKGEISRAERTEHQFAVLFLDMDGLKMINDEHGHLAGSRAVCRVADVLRRAVRSTDTPARFGGDEFVVILPETQEAGAKLVAQRLSDRLAADGETPVLSMSTGVAIYPRDGVSPAALLTAADRALYESKAQKLTGRTKTSAVPLRERAPAAMH